MLLANFAFMPKIALGAAATPGTISLAWPNSATGWTLQESTDLVTWTTSTRDFTNSGGQISITVTPAGRRTFFRLVHP